MHSSRCAMKHNVFIFRLLTVLYIAQNVQIWFFFVVFIKPPSVVCQCLHKMNPSGGIRQPLVLPLNCQQIEKREPLNVPAQGCLMRALALAAWVTCSVSLIIFNKIVLHKHAFAFPLTLTFLHMLANACVLLCVFEGLRLFPSPYRSEQRAHLIQSMAPVAVLFAAATCLRNSAYLYLPVPTIQLLSSTSPVFVYIISCCCGLDQCRSTLGLAVLVITGGCVWALSDSAASMPTFFLQGIGCQLSGLILEATRGCLLKRLMVDIGQMTPLTLLYIMSPMVCALLATPIMLTEINHAWTYLSEQNSHFFLLLGVNVALAVCLNWSSVYFLKSFSVTTTSITALVKDSVLILGTNALHHTASGYNFYYGYSVTVAGLMAYVTLRNR